MSAEWGEEDVEAVVRVIRAERAQTHGGWSALAALLASGVVVPARVVEDMASDLDHSAKFFGGFPEREHHVGRSKAFTEAAQRLRAALAQPTAEATP